MAAKRGNETGQLESEGYGRSRLQPGPGRDQRVRVCASLFFERAVEPADGLEDEFDRFFDLEDQCRIEDILAGGADVDGFCRRLILFFTCAVS